jgi:hypothetical protein
MQPQIRLDQEVGVLVELRRCLVVLCIKLTLVVKIRQQDVLDFQRVDMKPAIIVEACPSLLVVE